MCPSSAAAPWDGGSELSRVGVGHCRKGFAPSHPGTRMWCVCVQDIRMTEECQTGNSCALRRAGRGGMSCKELLTRGDLHMRCGEILCSLTQVGFSKLGFVSFTAL